MPAFLFVFGYETPAQHRNNAEHGWDDEDSDSVLIDAPNAEAALTWGREVAERFVRDLRKGPGPSWKDAGFAHWIDPSADAIAKAREAGVPQVSVGEYPSRVAHSADANPADPA
jgi:hypothetical protein